VEAHITVRGEGAAPDGGLLDWLRREPELRGCVKVEPRPSAGGDEAMAVPVGIVVSLLGQPVAYALLRSVRTWIEHRKPAVEFEVETERGRFHYKLVDASAGENAEVIRGLTDLIRDPQPPAAPAPDSTASSG